MPRRSSPPGTFSVGSMNPLLTLSIALPVVHGITLGASLVLPISAPVMVSEIGMNPAFVGIYSGVGFTFGTAAAFFCGGFIRRFGGWRMSQLALFASLVGLLAAIGEVTAMLILSAMLVGGSQTLISPAGSHVMARYVTAGNAPLFFSIKQVGVPLAGVIAGVVVPLVVVRFGWEWGFIFFAMFAAVALVAVQPFRAAFDSDRQPDYPLSPADAFARLRVILATPAYRQLFLGAVFFVGLQSSFSSFFVIYVVGDTAIDLAAAGRIFAIAQALAIGARIGWGWVGARYLPARTVMGVLGIGMGLAAILMAQFSPTWSDIAVTAVAALMAVTVLGWQGLIISEIARQVPLGEVGPYTAGILSTASLSGALFPIVMSGIFTATGSYALGFVGLGVLAAAGGIMFLTPAPKTPLAGTAGSAAGEVQP